MTKAGDEYQEIVALVARALDPGAVVKPGQWKTTADGKRDIDVEVHGSAGGKTEFIFIECKDWRRKVGIGVVDALDSKRKDLKADKTILYSNSGFSKLALQKAQRIGIQTLSALKMGDGRIRVAIHEEVVTKTINIKKWDLTIYQQPETAVVLPNNWTHENVIHNSLPLTNWIAKQSECVLGHINHRAIGDVKTIVATYSFSKPERFIIASLPTSLVGFMVTMHCDTKWLSQIIPIDVSLGKYDYQKGRITIPGNQTLYWGAVDMNAWKETSKRPRTSKADPDSGSSHLDIKIALYRSILPVSTLGIPDIASLINEQRLQVDGLNIEIAEITPNQKDLADRIP